MELKKSPKADLQNKRGLFLEIGLALSLLLMIGAFAWNQKEKKIEKIDLNIAPVEEEIIEITHQDQKPPEQPVAKPIAVVSDILNIVKNDTKITSEITFDDFSEDAVVAVAPAKVTEEKVEDDAPFLIAEEMPSFMGGDLNTFRAWVQERLNYPTIAAENGISGRVTLTFVIERDGSLTNIEVVSTPDRSLSEEAVRVLKTSPKWTPGKQRSAPVRVKYTLPVEFRLQ